MRTLAIGAVTLCLLATAANAQIHDTLTVDVVALHSGTELPGRADLSIAHENFVYLFADAQNRRQFAEAPHRYQVQMGGGCGRMGPLSGLGKIELRELHAGRLYIFASEACRNTFRKHPDKLLIQDDATPSVDAEAAATGARLLEKVMESIGGAAAVDAVRGYQLRNHRPAIYENQNVDVVETVTFAAPDRFRRDSKWHTWESAMVQQGESGYFIGSDGTTRTMYKPMRDAFHKIYARDLLYLLKMRNAEGFSVAGLGEDEVAGAKVEKLQVHYRGTTTLFNVSARTGRIVSMQYRGRGPNLLFGDVERFFTDYRLVDGLVLPATRSGTFNGDIVAGWSRTYTIRINPEVDEQSFIRSE